MKLRVETQKPVKLNLTDTQTNESLSHSTTIQPLPVMQIGTVETLAEGEEATASFSGDPRTPSLNLGIPVGATGARGADGSDGESAGFGTPTVTVTDLEHGDPATVSITASGPDTAKVFAFSFGIPAGPKGDPGDPSAGAVTSVNGKTGEVVLVPSDIGALPDTYTPPAQIYWAAYGITTSAQIEAAYQAGQEVICFYSNRFYRLAYRTSATSHTFAYIYSSTTYRITCSSNTWSTADTAMLTSAPVTSVNGQTGAVTLSIPSKVSDLTNDSGFLTLQTLPIYSGGVS